MAFSGSGQSRALSSQGMLGGWFSEVSHHLAKVAVPQFPLLLPVKDLLGTRPRGTYSERLGGGTANQRVKSSVGAPGTEGLAA